MVKVERLKEDLAIQEEILQELKTRMHKDVDEEDFEHLTRLGAEANGVKAKIQTLKKMITLIA